MKVWAHLRVQTKIVAATMLAVVAALVLAGTTLYLSEGRGVHKTGGHYLPTLAEVIGGTTPAGTFFSDKSAATETLTALRSEPQILAASIYDRKGALFATFNRAGFQTQIPPLPGADGYAQVRDRLAYFGAIDDERERRRIGTIYLEADLGVIHDRLRSYAQLLGIVLVVSSLVAFALSTMIQRSISGPIVKLARTTKQVSVHSDYSLRVSQESNDELGELAASFNEMLSQVESRDLALKEKNLELEA